MQPHIFWLSWAGAMVTLGAVFVAVSGGLAAAKEDYPFWTSAPMLVAYFFFVISVLCMVAAIRDVPIPFRKKTEWRVAGDTPLHERPAVQQASRRIMKDAGLLPPWWKRLWGRRRR